MCDEILVCAYGQINLRMSHGSFLLLVMIKLFLFFGVAEDSRFDKPNWSMSEEMRKERKNHNIPYVGNKYPIKACFGTFECDLLHK